MKGPRDLALRSSGAQLQKKIVSMSRAEYVNVVVLRQAQRQLGVIVINFVLRPINTSVYKGDVR